MKGTVDRLKYEVYVEPWSSYPGRYLRGTTNLLCRILGHVLWKDGRGVFLRRWTCERCCCSVIPIEEIKSARSSLDE